MLTRFHQILLGLLAVQVGLAVYTSTRDERATPVKERPLLAGYDASGVTRLQVQGGGASDRPIDLVKQDGGWVLASGFGYPADASKVTEALGTLGRMSAGAPIATQAGRHRQLRVDDADFERRLTVTAGGKDTTVVVGGPAGARRTAVRAGGAAVYAVAGVSAYAFATDARSWMEPTVVKIARDEIARIVVEKDGRRMELTKVPAAPAPAAAPGEPPPPPPPPGWQVTFAGAPPRRAAGEALDVDKLSAMADHAVTIAASEPADPARPVATPTATITIERVAANGATPAPTVIEVVADGERYWVHERGARKAALVEKVSLEHVLDATPTSVVKEAEPPAPAGGEPPLTLDPPGP
jgi:hypothetical protein